MNSFFNLIKFQSSIFFNNLKKHAYYKLLIELELEKYFYEIKVFCTTIVLPNLINRALL